MAFGSCTVLERIVVDADWALSTLYDNCTSLVGGAGTAYSASRISGDYMRIDVEGIPGYLTSG